MAVVNQLTQIDDISYSIIEHLMLNNENIWKILKYNTTDALTKPNLTLDEKTALIYSGGEFADNYKVFRQSFTDDAMEYRNSRLHVFLGYVQPIKAVYGMVDVCFEIMTHNKDIPLDNYKNRNEVMAQEIVNTLNDAYVGGVGNLFFNYNVNYRNMLQLKFFNKYYQGYTLVMSCYGV